MSGREDYWRVSLEEILGEHEIELPLDTIVAIAKDLVCVAEMESEALGYTNIPNPLQEKIKKLQLARECDIKKFQKIEDIYRKDIAQRIGPKIQLHQVGLTQDGEVEVRELGR
jgi:hypothetical protein